MKLTVKQSYLAMFHLLDVFCEIKGDDCLENLLLHCRADLVCVPLRITTDNNISYHDIKKINITNPVKNIWKSIPNIDDFQNEIIPIEGFTFEGPIFHRNVLEKIGFADKKFFIYADDTEYSIRALKQKIKACIIKKAVLKRQLPFPENAHKFDWKTYYIVRNLIAIDVLYGNFIVRWLRPFGYTLAWLLRGKNFTDIKTVLKAFKDGYFYKS